MTQLNLINVKNIFFMKLGSLLSARCRHRSMKISSMEGHTSLSTALVCYQYFILSNITLGPMFFCCNTDVNTAQLTDL